MIQTFSPAIALHGTVRTGPGGALAAAVEPPAAPDAYTGRHRDPRGRHARTPAGEITGQRLGARRR